MTQTSQPIFFFDLVVSLSAGRFVVILDAFTNLTVDVVPGIINDAQCLQI